MVELFFEPEASDLILEVPQHKALDGSLGSRGRRQASHSICNDRVADESSQPLVACKTPLFQMDEVQKLFPEPSTYDSMLNEYRQASQAASALTHNERAYRIVLQKSRIFFLFWSVCWLA